MAAPSSTVFGPDYARARHDGTTSLIGGYAVGERRTPDHGAATKESDELCQQAKGEAERMNEVSD
jgi:hypothetical protein